MNRTILVASALLALVVAPGTARACYCLSSMYSWVAPPDGADDLPVNAKIWVAHPMSYLDEEDLWVCPELRAQGGGIVKGSCSMLETIGGTGITVFHPDTELLPGEEYTAETWWDTWTFETGDWRDDEAPEPPEVVDIEGVSDGLFWEGTDCGADHGAVLHAHFDGMLLALDVADTETLETDPITGMVAGVSGSDEVFAGESNSCRGQTWPDAAPLASTTVRLGVFDIAGNFSGFGDPVDIQVPPAGCSCAHDPGGPLVGGAALALALAFLAALRRSQATLVRCPPRRPAA